MSKRRGLGKGLQALIPVPAKSDADSEGIIEICIDEVRPSGRQARKIFNEVKLTELATSIKKHGVIQPVIVRPLKESGYELIAGERRWRACKILGYEKIPAIVKEYMDMEAATVSLIENVQREDLNPLEEALAYHYLINDHGLTQEEVSKRVGKSRPFVANMIRLLGLPDEIKEMLVDGQLNTGHARALLAIRDTGKQLAAAGKIAGSQMSVRQAEKLVKDLENKKEVIKKNKVPRSQYIDQAEAILKNFMDAKVKIKRSDSGGGRLEISFTNEADLKRIIDMFLSDKLKPE